MSSWKVAVGARAPRWVLPAVRSIHRSMHAWTHRKLPPVVQISVPKAGTHLFREALVALGYRLVSHNAIYPRLLRGEATSIAEAPARALRRGEFLTDHLPHSPEMETLLRGSGARLAFIGRDPRAVTLSWIHYATDRHGELGPIYRALPGMRERIEQALAGTSHVVNSPTPPMGELLDRFEPWLRARGVFRTRFEDLVGERGGGSELVQRREIRRLIAFLGIGGAEDEVEALVGRVSAALFRENAATFRKGRIDAWREELDAECAALLERGLEKRIRAWGYAEDDGASRGDGT